MRVVLCILEQGVDRPSGQLFPAIEKGQFHEKIELHDLDLKMAADQLCGGRNGSAGSQDIVNDQDFLTGLQRVSMDFDGIGAIFQLVG